MGKTTKLLAIAILFGALFLGASGGIMAATGTTSFGVSYTALISGEFAPIVMAQSDPGDPNNGSGG